MVRSVVVPVHSMPYGAPELKAVARSFMLRATASASLLWSMLFAALVVLSWFGPSTRVESFPVPPGIVVSRYDSPIAPRVVEAKHRTAITARRGEVVPVRDDIRPPDKFTAPAVEENHGSEDALSNSLDGAAQRSEGAAEPPPPSRTEFRMVDQEPIAILTPSPVYPEIARDAGVEGRVVIALLIDRNGHVRDVYVERSVLMLDDAVIEATRRWVFQPALIANRPVMAWVRVPFDFRLH